MKHKPSYFNSPKVKTKRKDHHNPQSENPREKIMMMRTDRGSRSNTNNVWSDTLIYMPIGVSSEVAARIPYSDLIHSAAVCRSWKVGIDHVHQNPSLLHLPSIICWSKIWYGHSYISKSPTCICILWNKWMRLIEWL